jgi:hypothetical protein
MDARSSSNNMMEKSNKYSSKASIVDDSSSGAERANKMSKRSIENEAVDSSSRHPKSTLLLHHGFTRALLERVLRRGTRAKSAGSRFHKRAASAEDDTELVEKNRSIARDDEQTHSAGRWYEELAESPEYQVLVLGQLHGGF